MRTHSEIVIVGGGIAGASIAYHLALLGKREVVVLDQGDLVGGTTSHAPGLVGQLRTSPALVQMLRHSVALYQTLSSDAIPGFLREGSLRLATTRARADQIQRHAALARSAGLDSQFLTAQETLDRYPFLRPDDILGALWIPDDGSANATVLARAMIHDATMNGVEFHAKTPVLEVEVTDGRVRSVLTSAGRIVTETLIVAAGIWSPRIGAMAGVRLPLTPMEHQYAVTAPLPELSSSMLPNLRDPDRLIYVRQREQSLVLGGYERNPQPLDVDAIPSRPDPTLRRFEAARFRLLHQNALHRLPALAQLPFEQSVNGLESFTPDGEFLLGPAPEVPNFWAACGFCAHGVSSAGGVGKVMAEWLVNSDPGVDVSGMSLQRFLGKPLTKQEIQAAAARVYATYYDLEDVGK